MGDREKVIKRLEECLSASCRGFRTCPYSDDPEWDAVEAALALLKEQEREQEPVKTKPVRFRVVRAGGSNYPFWDCVCDGCGFKTSIAHTNWRFCPECGRKVKWDD